MATSRPRSPAIKHGRLRLHRKAVQIRSLAAVVERALEAARLRRENARRSARRGRAEQELIGTSPRCQCSSARQIQRVAPTGSRVLITGPAGVGKEVVARQLHESPSRVRRALRGAELRRHARRTGLEEELFGAEAAIDGGTAPPTKIGTLRAGPWRHPAARRGRRHAATSTQSQDPAGACIDQAFDPAGRNGDRIDVDVRVISRDQPRPAAR